jgi:hypothetical protein
MGHGNARSHLLRRRAERRRQEKVVGRRLLLERGQGQGVSCRLLRRVERQRVALNPVATSLVWRLTRPATRLLGSAHRHRRSLMTRLLEREARRHPLRSWSLRDPLDH